jgi:small subunit ribosomal protein S17
MQKRKTFTGVITSNRMKNTVVVKVTRTIKHPTYGKVVQVNKKYYAHTEASDHQIGDQVTIVETRPLSKLKRWRVAN